MFFQIHVPEDGVVDASFFVHEVCQDCVKPPVISFAGPDESLRVSTVAIPPPRCNERGEVAIAFSEWYAVVSVPGVSDGFPCVLRNRPGLFRWGIGDPGFSLAEFVQGLKVHRAAGRAVVLADTYHALAPLRGVSDGFDDSHFDVIVEVLFYPFLPVQGYGSRC